MLELLLYYKRGDTAHYEACRGEIWEQLPTMHAAEFSNAASNLFDCAMDAGDSVQIEHILAAMDDYLTRNPQEIQIGAASALARQRCAGYDQARARHV